MSLPSRIPSSSSSFFFVYLSLLCSLFLSLFVAHLLRFKLVAVDLLEIFVRREPHSPSLVEFLLPLLLMMRRLARRQSSIKREARAKRREELEEEEEEYDDGRQGKKDKKKRKSAKHDDSRPRPHFLWKPLYLKLSHFFRSRLCQAKVYASFFFCLPLVFVSFFLFPFRSLYLSVSLCSV